MLIVKNILSKYFHLLKLIRLLLASGGWRPGVSCTSIHRRTGGRHDGQGISGGIASSPTVDVGGERLTVTRDTAAGATTNQDEWLTPARETALRR